MSLVNNSANNFKDFLDAIKPFLNYQFYDMSGQGVEANNFSTDEKVIGTWIDGKPLYQKTVNCGSLPINTNKIVAHNISNIGNVVFASGFAFNSSANVSLCIGYTATSSDRKADIGILVNGTSIEIRTYRESVSSYTESYVTLRYTKTTDTAVASGEKIVGQWIDGKPVYQKTIIVENPTSTGTSIQYAHNISNFGELIDIKGITQLSTSAISANVYSGADYHSMISADNTYLYYNMKWGQTSITKLSATLRYTKTTD